MVVVAQAAVTELMRTSARRVFMFVLGWRFLLNIGPRAGGTGGRALRSDVVADTDPVTAGDISFGVIFDDKVVRGEDAKSIAAVVAQNISFDMVPIAGGV